MAGFSQIPSFTSCSSRGRPDMNGSPMLGKRATVLKYRIVNHGFVAVHDQIGSLPLAVRMER